VRLEKIRMAEIPSAFSRWITRNTGAARENARTLRLADISGGRLDFADRLLVRATLMYYMALRR
jgi:hypothetical protein